ncbi:MAG: DUF2169 domain-containing protein [Gammaproteobacteria bacterium]|nr:DUF2169 domain-containing protein [Gammaproteobacteria bacterium]
MLQLKNESPFAPAITLFADENGVDALYVVIKATFTYNGVISIAEEQIPPQMEDEFWGEPVESSIKYASEMHLTKPSTDIIVIGHAYAPPGKKVQQMDCGIKVGNYAKALRVFGDRYWQGMQISEPEPFDKMPLIYENAFGGAYITHEKNDKGEKVEKHMLHEINPVGRGYRKLGKEAVNGEKLPNIEDPRKLIKLPGDKPPPAGMGFLSPTWKPRVEFAGTYDEAWQKSRAPYLPKDFDNRFFNAAAPELTCKEYLKGGEMVMMIGLSPDGPKKFALPVVNLDCAVKIAGGTEKPDTNLETIVFEPDESRFCMTWRAKVSCDKKALKISEVRVQANVDGMETPKKHDHEHKHEAVA